MKIEIVEDKRHTTYMKLSKQEAVEIISLLSAQIAGVTAQGGLPGAAPTLHVPAQSKYYVLYVEQPELPIS